MSIDERAIKLVKKTIKSSKKIKGEELDVFLGTMIATSLIRLNEIHGKEYVRSFLKDAISSLDDSIKAQGG